MSQIILELALDQIVPSPTNPRKYFNETALKELAASIQQTKGVIQAVTVRPHPRHPKKYELVCGERRYRASIIAAMPSISAVEKVLTDDEVQELQFIENIEREDVHPMDEAVTFKMMQENKHRPWLLDDIAAKINKPVSYIVQRLLLNKLIPELQKDFWDDKFLIGHAFIFSRLTEDDQKACRKDSSIYSNKEYKNLNQVKEYIDRVITRKISAALFTPDDNTLKVKCGAGSCAYCFKRSGGANASLFPDVKENDRCFDKTCFEQKTDAWLVKEVRTVLDTKPDILLVHYDYSGNKIPVEILKLAKEYKVHILNLSKNEFQTYKESNCSAFKALYVSGSNKGKYETVYRKLAGKAKIAAKAAAGEKISAADIDEQIISIKNRLTRGVELDAEKVWAQISETIRDSAKLKQEVLLNTNAIQEEKNAFAYALLLNLRESYKNTAAELLGLKETWFRSNPVARNFKDVNDAQLFLLLRLYTLSVLNEGLSHQESHGPIVLMKMLQTDLYFKDDIALLISDQEEVKNKREANADKRIAALEQEKKALKPNKEKVAPAAKKVANKVKKSTSKIKKLIA